jgi:hypothetical protein
MAQQLGLDVGRIKDFAQGLREAEDHAIGDALKVAAVYLGTNYLINSAKKRK